MRKGWTGCQPKVHRAMRFTDITGQRFGRLTAQWPVGKSIKALYWLCLCDCGSLHIVRGTGIRYGADHLSCGCLHSAIKTTHGMYGTPEYAAYSSAKWRCTNPQNHAWKDYGGRGIQFLFDNFEHFLAEVGPRPKGRTLDRIDNDGHYAPGNVRWATRSQQQMNQRRQKHKIPIKLRAQLYYQKKRALLAALPVHYTQEEWEALKVQIGNICLCCRKQKPLCPDHVIPLCHGGSDDIGNIQPLCGSCNSKKFTKHTDYRKNFPSAA